jgi:hypothetical protein
MSLELDWLEREERYRRRVNRLMTVFVILVAVVLGTGAYLRSKHSKESREAAARAAEQQRLAEARRQREQFSADSTAAAERYASFKEAQRATPLDDLPFLQIPLPSGQPVRPFVERLWTEYVRVVDPQATSEQEITWGRQNFIELMNDGPLRGRAVLLPILEQSGTRLEIRSTSFSQITKAQVAVGMREAPEEEAPVDSLGIGLVPVAMPAEGESPPAVEPGSTAETGETATGAASGASSAEPADAEPSATTPPTPVPPETVPAETAPAEAPAPSSAPADTVPRP